MANDVWWKRKEKEVEPVEVEVPKELVETRAKVESMEKALITTRWVSRVRQ